MVGLGGGGCATSYAERHSTCRDTGHTCFLSPWSRACGGGRQHSDNGQRTRESLGVTSLPTLPYMQKKTEMAKKYFCCFRSRTRGLVRPDPTSSLIQSHSDRWPWARSNNYEKRDNLAHTERSDAQSDVGAPVNNYGKRRWSVSFLL